MDRPGEEGMTPLYVACSSGVLDTAKILVEVGQANIHHRAKGDATAFYAACKAGHIDVARYLLSKGADHNHVLASGYRPLHGACETGKIAIVDMLLAAPDVRVDCREGLGRSPLWLACRFGHLAVIQLLLSAGSDPMLADRHGVTPLDLTELIGHPKDVEAKSCS